MKLYKLSTGICALILIGIVVVCVCKDSKPTSEEMEAYYNSIIKHDEQKNKFRITNRTSFRIQAFTIKTDSSEIVIEEINPLKVAEGEIVTHKRPGDITYSFYLNDKLHTEKIGYHLKKDDDVKLYVSDKGNLVPDDSDQKIVWP